MSDNELTHPQKAKRAAVEQHNSKNQRKQLLQLK